MLLRLLLLLLPPLRWAGSLAHSPGYRLTVPKSVPVQEGRSIFIPCTVYYPWGYWKNFPPAWGYWFKKEAHYDRDPPVATNHPSREVLKETEGRFHLLGDPSSYNCSLHIKDARKQDTGVYFFRVERGKDVKYSYRGDHLCVFVTETPDVHVAGTLESGLPGNITCAVPWPCEQGTPPAFSWIGVNLTSTLGPQTPRSSVLTITPEPRHHGSNLTCRVTFPGARVAVERTVRLSVAYAPRNLTIQVFQRNSTGFTALAEGSIFHVQEGQALLLVCVADSNPPAELSWTWGSLALQPSRYSGRGVLELPRVELEADGKYTCSARHRLGSLTASVSLSVKEQPGPRTGAVPGALGGAGVVVLLAVCLCLVFFTVKSYRRNLAEKGAGRDGTRPAMSTGSLGHHGPLNGLEAASAPAQPASATGEEQELHYASLSLQGLKPREPPDRDSSATEYAAIRIRK